MNYQKLTIVGNITRDAERKTSQEGDVSYVTFRVGVSAAKKRTVFFPIILFGKRGDALVQYLTKGREVLIEGRIESSNTGRMRVIADQLEFGSQPGKSHPTTKATGYMTAKQVAENLTSAD